MLNGSVPGNHRRGESGQILILSFMLFILLLGFLAIVVDVGFFLHRRERVQHVADAAALAGAQELPDSMVLAEDLARTWADRNGLDGSTIDVTFECRSTNPLHCDPSGADTIIVEGEMKAPLTMMPVLRLIGASGSSCWLNDGCTVAGRAAACRGECTTAITPVDIVLIMDRTGSMTSGGGIPSDLDRAKDGARAMLGVLNPALQHVGLAVLPPSQSQNFNGVCQADTSEPWTSSDNWLIAQLADNYQNSDGSLNTSSRLVRALGCLNSAGFTDIGHPIQAARQHLQALGRPEANWAIVLLSDGAANRPQGGNPCQLAANEADIAKSLEIEIFAIGYGTEDNTDPGFTCGIDTGAWAGDSAEQLLGYIATDSSHFFQEPQGSDLTDVFEEIGRQLASGSRLVE
ncbi:MAG: vWA domain-containing protein [Dehalococcoidia bacterium]